MNKDFLTSIKTESGFPVKELKLDGSFIQGYFNEKGKWKSHSRPINIEVLKELRLEVEDYSNDENRRRIIRDYYELASDYVKSKDFNIFVQTRNFI